MRKTARRMSGAVAALAASALVLSACSSSNDAPSDNTTTTAPSGEKVTLSFWGWATGLEDSIATWNSKNPDIQVDFYRMTGDDGDKIPTAIDSGTAPDIVQMEGGNIPQHVINNRLIDVAAYTTDIKDAFPEGAWNNVTFGDSIYGVPQDSGPTALMYRSDLFEAAGVDVPTTWDEYIEAARSLKEENPDTYIAQLSPNEAGFWTQEVVANGGTWFSIENDAWKVSVNDAASQKVAEVWQTLLDEDLVKVVEMWTPEYWASISDGSIATVNYAAWFPALLQENAKDLAGDWSVAPSPTFDGQPAAGTAGGSVDVIPTGTEHVAEAMQFLTWLNASEEGVNTLLDGGIFPAATVGLESDRLLTENEYFGGQVINEVFAAAAESVPTGWTPGPTHDLAQDAIKDQFAKVVNGRQSFSEALDAVQASTVKDVANLGLSVVE
ncbi:ABC transporter substrate-binding protein [Populibacterium corticicola]|uniref:ABC transporter substrate-binding protein n=1 Tax=Populibacterium corticicola TaxID=1812826 RepID=A0ABW5XHI0_9MICO